MTKEDIAYICAAVKGSEFIREAIKQSHQRRCDYCHRDINAGSLCDRCSKLDYSEAELIERAGGRR